METKNFISADLVKSNKSNNQVWMVSCQDTQPKFCKNARTALRYIFMLKKNTGAFIPRSVIEQLKMEISLSKDPEDPVTMIRRQIEDSKPQPNVKVIFTSEPEKPAEPKKRSRSKKSQKASTAAM